MSSNSVKSVTCMSGFVRLAIVAAAVPAPPPPMTIRRSLMWTPPWIDIRYSVSPASVFDTQQTRRARSTSSARGSSSTSAEASTTTRP